jgi:hypothetical protein
MNTIIFGTSLLFAAVVGFLVLAGPALRNWSIRRSVMHGFPFQNKRIRRAVFRKLRILQPKFYWEPDFTSCIAHLRRAVRDENELDRSLDQLVRLNSSEIGMDKVAPGIAAAVDMASSSTDSLLLLSQLEELLKRLKQSDRASTMNYYQVPWADLLRAIQGISACGKDYEVVYLPEVSHEEGETPNDFCCHDGFARSWSVVDQPQSVAVKPAEPSYGLFCQGTGDERGR